MSNNRLVRNAKSAKLKANRKKPKKSSPKDVPAGAIQVTDDNAHLLMVKYQELILAELRKQTRVLEGVNG